MKLSYHDLISIHELLINHTNDLKEKIYHNPKNTQARVDLSYWENVLEKLRNNDSSMDNA
jgi:hypothetical protein